MTSLHIPDDETLHLPDVTSGVHGLRLLFVNVYGLDGPNGWVLVDAGIRGSASRIRGWVDQQFGGRPPTAVVLTHAHFDHVGALEELLEHWDVPVYAHRAERPYLSGLREYPPPNPSAGGGLLARLSPLFPRTPIDIRDRLVELPLDGTVPDLPDWQWVHTPGHTPGHVALFRAGDRTLLPGDAFCTTAQESFFAVATQRAELHGPPAYFTPDWDAARDSVRRLAALSPSVVAPGHGQPMAGPETARGLVALAARFDEMARPARGRTLPFAAREATGRAARVTRRAVDAIAPGGRPPISPAQHAVLDYAVAGTFFAMGAYFATRHRPAAQLAFANGAMVLGMSLLTDYPGGLYRTLSFKTHRAGDVVQAALAAFGPAMMGFAQDPEARYFQWQAASEVGVIAATDWNAAP